MNAVKIVSVVFALIVTFTLFVTNSYASEQTDFGQDELSDALPEEVQDKLDNSGISPENNGVLSLSADSLLDSLWNTLCNEITKPLQMLAALVAVVLMCALAESLRDASGNGNCTEAFRIVGILAGTGIITGYTSECLDAACVTIEATGTFMLTFIPIFAGIIAVNGQISSATVFNSVLMAAAQIFSQLSVMLIMPLSGAILGVSAASSINGDLHIERMAELIKKVVIWGLTLLVTLFVGLLSLQNFVAVSADTVTMKAAKFAISTSVPFVGGAVSDALSTVKGSLGLMKSSFGTFGIVAAIMLIFPTLLSAFCYKLSLFAAGCISELFGAKTLAALIKSGEYVMSIVIAVLFCFLLLLSVSAAIMLFTGTGATV